MRANDNPSVQPVPDHLDYEMWTGPAPLRPYDGLPHVRWWRTFTEYGNGIVGDMCVHMLDTVRWMLGLRWPTQISSAGGIYVQKSGKSNISDTQVATFEYDNLNVSWTHRTWGNPPDPKYPWALFLYGEKGTLKASTMSYDFYPTGKDEPAIHKDCVFEREQFPEDVKEPQIELNAAPATRLHMKDFVAAIGSRGRPVADIEEGHISTATCILANVAARIGRPIRWDAQQGRISGDDDANALLKRPYRAPWVHPANNAT
jgi:predicted dehydrogenase